MKLIFVVLFLSKSLDGTSLHQSVALRLNNQVESILEVDPSDEESRNRADQSNNNEEELVNIGRLIANELSANHAKNGTEGVDAFEPDPNNAFEVLSDDQLENNSVTTLLELGISTKITYCGENGGPSSGYCYSRTNGETIYNFLSYWSGHCYSRSFPGQSWWVFQMPARCPSGYEEAASLVGPNGGRCGVATSESSSGTSRYLCACNDVLSCALRHSGVSVKPSCTSAATPYVYQKVRVCVKAGAACLPGQAMNIKEDTYYNIVLADNPTLMLSSRLIGQEREVFTPGSTWYWQQQTPGQFIWWNTDASKSKNQWRFQRRSNGKYNLINRQTGRYLQSSYYDYSKGRDWVGKLVKSTDATPVSVSGTCDWRGTVQLSTELSGQTQGFKSGAHGGLAFTASDYTDSHTTSCCSSGCPSGWSQSGGSYSDGCFIFCKYQKCSLARVKSAAYKKDQDFYLREVSAYESPDISKSSIDVNDNPIKEMAISMAGSLLSTGVTTVSNKLQYGNWNIDKSGKLVN